MPVAEQANSRLSHLDATGAALMVDVSDKAVSKRMAVATAMVRTTGEVVGLISSAGLPKGDALATARVAGILAAKRTSDLIPLCHQLALSRVSIDFDVGTDEIKITATVKTTDRTGVEMDALLAVSVAALTVYDMIKAVDAGASIHEVRVVSKAGGRNGNWSR